MQTLTNSFHQTMVRTKLTAARMNAIEQKAATQPWLLTPAEKQIIRRIHNTLCPSKGCICGDFWGRR